MWLREHPRGRNSVPFSRCTLRLGHGAQIKRDELRRQFGEQIRIEYHFLRLFGDVSARIDAGWGDSGGAAERERFPAVKQVVAQTVRDPDAAARAGSARLETG